MRIGVECTIANTPTIENATAWSSLKSTFFIVSPAVFSGDSQPPNLLENVKIIIPITNGAKIEEARNNLSKTPNIRLESEVNICVIAGNTKIPCTTIYKARILTAKIAIDNVYML